MFLLIVLAIGMAIGVNYATDENYSLWGEHYQVYFDQNGFAYSGKPITITIEQDEEGWRTGRPKDIGKIMSVCKEEEKCDAIIY
jgi:hypothetical protein